MYDEFFVKANELTQKGIPFATATVVRAEKPTSGKPGDKAIIAADGAFYGWIGGSCAQPTVIKEAMKALADGKFRFIRLSADPEKQSPREGLVDLPMTCFSGGTLEIYIEPQYSQPRLIVIGNMQVAGALIELGKAMSYEVIAVDPDGDGAALIRADRVLTKMEAVVEFINPNVFVVVATHGNLDEMVLEEALKAKPAYVGLVASQKRFQSVLEYLKIQGLSDEDFTPLKAPAGLDIGAQRGDEIALSIMAEIVQCRRTKIESYDLSAHQSEKQVVQKAIAIDPVCGMEVEIATAKITHEYEGETYYFCCPGCKGTFVADPEKLTRLSTSSR